MVCEHLSVTYDLDDLDPRASADPTAYSEVVRKKKIVEAVERGMPKIEVARAFGAGISSVKRYVASYREGRSLVPNKRPGSKPKLWTGAQGSCWRRTSESAPRGHAGAEARVPAA